ncbi:MAG TPA: cytochrome ubiquinol oxidase subunit I [Chthonomonadaceae bacterium]|nr:cytochrome ubiquinol oxidase subunit I [Chthonomonadaceae bacterium]
MDAVTWGRFQFGFTATFHYLFPQLTMGLALIILLFKTCAIVRKDPRYDTAARFWARIFGINFAVGVVTGIPMEFQFGTNWAQFSNFSGGVIGLTLAMEGMFAFFAESAFLGLFLFGETRLGPRAHLVTAFMMFLGSWLSGYFIITTNAFMQHPMGYAVGREGSLQLADVGRYLTNPWALWQYAHTMSASVVTAAFVVASVGAFYTLNRRSEEQARIYVKVGALVGLAACLLQLFPTGDRHGKLMARYQPAALAAMEAKFHTGSRADLAIIGQPDMRRRRLENPILVPGVLSYLAYGSFGAEVKGLDAYPADQRPDNVELLYYAYHIMVGLGTLLIGVMSVAAALALANRLHKSRAMLWILMLGFPFPYIATTAGWLTAEIGRQPWLIYGLQRTVHGASPLVSGGSIAFSTIGFMGMYLVLGLLFLYLIMREIGHGPDYVGPEKAAPTGMDGDRPAAEPRGAGAAADRSGGAA